MQSISERELDRLRLRRSAWSRRRRAGSGGVSGACVTPLALPSRVQSPQAPFPRAARRRAAPPATVPPLPPGAPPIRRPAARGQYPRSSAVPSPCWLWRPPQGTAAPPAPAGLTRNAASPPPGPLPCRGQRKRVRPRRAPGERLPRGGAPWGAWGRQRRLVLHRPGVYNASLSGGG